MYIGLHVKCPLFFSDFKENWIFPKDFQKKTQISNFMKIRLVGVEMFHADKQTDMTQLVFAFRSTAKGPKKHINTCCRHNVWMSNLMVNEVYVTDGRYKHSSSFTRRSSFSHATKLISFSTRAVPHWNIPCCSNAAFKWTTDVCT